MDIKMCPEVEKALYILGKKWTGLIVVSLLNGPLKYSQLEKGISGISSRMLTERLKELAKEGIIAKNVYSEIPIKVEYQLTEMGLGLADTYEKIIKWAKNWF